MSGKWMQLMGAWAFVLCMFIACGSGSDPVSSGSSDSGANSGSGSSDTVSDAESDNGDSHDDAADYTWDGEKAVQIVLNGSSATVSAAGATAEGGTVTVSAAGTYVLSGTLSDGQVVVNTTETGMVRLILNGVDITSSSSAPIYIKKADKAMLVLADNTTNKLKDGSSYVYDDAAEEEPNAAVFSKSNLTVYGNGSLAVEARFNDGITSKDGLVISSGTLAVSAKDDGIRGKDYLIVKDGRITVNSSGDGLKSDNENDASLGYVLIENGTLTVTAGGDALSAQTDVLIKNGELTLTAGGGSGSYVSESSTSSKGVKAVASLIVDGGTLTVNSADDALHSNGSVTINGGDFTLSTGDDGVHADADLTVNGGEINVAKSYEGLESRTVLTVNAGTVYVVSSDDGFNVAGGVDGSGWPGGPPGGFDDGGDYYLYINGGYIMVNANGDGLDSNGSITMTGGVVIVNGPTANDNGALDHSSFKLTGGFLIAVGSAGMAQGPSTTSTQYSVLLNLGSAQPAGTLVHLQNSDGTGVLTFKPAKKYQSIVFSSTGLVKGGSYDLYLGGSDSGTAVDGLYPEGTYTPGSKYTSFTISSIVTGGQYR